MSNIKIGIIVKRSIIFLSFLVITFFFVAESATPELNYITVPDTLKTINPDTKHSIESQLVTTVLTRYHYNRFQLNDSLSALIFNKYLDQLDGGKNYFLKSDIDEFSKYKFELDDFLAESNIQFFFDVFNVYLKRVAERMDYINKLLENEFDYSTDEYYIIKRDSIDWAKSEKELNDDWRKRIKNDALLYKLNGKEWDFIKSTIQKRYKNITKYLFQYNSEDVFQLAMNAFAETIDPHTNYFSPITSDNFKIDMSLSLEGIGARLQVEDDFTKIVEVIPGGPADKSKQLKADDKIIGVAQGNDGEFEDVIGWRVNDVVKLIRGEKGTVVRLLVIPAGSDLNAKPKEVKLVRDKVKLEDQAAKSNLLEIENNGKNFKIGVINIPKFYSDFEAQRNGEDGKSTTKDVRKLISELEQKNIDGLIIDLRNDGGGSLTEAVELTGLFIKNGPVVQVRNSSNNVEINSDPDTSIIYNGPLAVMVNRFSASASEIFAAAIQDYGRGIIIGENTFGKGTVQNLIDLNMFTNRKNMRLGQVKLTVAKFYRINGKSTQRLGVKPDIELPSYFLPAEFGESSEPSALPFDEIRSLNYEKFGDIQKFIAELLKRHNIRTENDPDFQYLIDQIKQYRETRNRSLVSLNDEVRHKQKEADEEIKFQRQNELRKKKGLKLLDKGEIPDEKTDNTDYILNESAKILSDYILLTIG
ncbi:carboxy terminal-processing peptidase [Ignavibacterium sp.]|uniref:carboxy terminal-processing peptidase n=1 Tax=Ignavibacterium sp. TaxID=2651167 RepID=UPI00307EE3C4